MFQVRLHGRGGQGSVTGAELLSMAAFDEGKFAQAFPSFGSERMGAPVMAFCRIDDREIRLREPVVQADAVLIQDATLLHCVEVFQGLQPDGYVLINTRKELEALGLDDLRARLPSGHLRTVPASELAMKHVGKPVPSAALLGGFVALCKAIRLSSLEQALHERFAGKMADANIAAARDAYAAVQRGSSC